MRLIVSNGLSGRVSLLGLRSDIPAINAALDIACSSSLSEGFPNTIGEAMATGVPCVATDVGESKMLIGNTGLAVPPRDPGAFASALLQLIESGRATRSRMGLSARSRIKNNFPLSLAAQRYELMYSYVSRHLVKSVST
jgi:glycosyltransferase involved in cell wall biosynthesis